MKYLKAAAISFLITGAIPASAAPILYFGENLTPNGTVSGSPLTARNNFVGSLTSGVSTENFETGGLSLTFPGSTGNIGATLSGGNASVSNVADLGRFATSGTRFVETESGSGFTIDFTDPISAFGFYGTDIGDFGNQLTLVLENGGTVELAFDHTVGSDGSTDGALAFFGFIDEDDAYTKIIFENQPLDTDVFGFDDMIIGDVGQIGTIIPPTTVVPVPASLVMLLTALFGTAFAARRS